MIIVHVCSITKYGKRLTGSQTKNSCFFMVKKVMEIRPFLKFLSSIQEILHQQLERVKPAKGCHIDFLPLNKYIE